MTVLLWAFLCGIVEKEKTSNFALLLILIWAIAFDICIIMCLLK